MRVGSGIRLPTIFEVRLEIEGQTQGRAPAIPIFIDCIEAARVGMCPRSLVCVVGLFELRVNEVSENAVFRPQRGTAGTSTRRTVS